MSVASTFPTRAVSFLTKPKPPVHANVLPLQTAGGLPAYSTRSVRAGPLGSRLAGDRVIRKKMQAVRGSENSFDHKLDGEYTEKKMKMETNAGPDGSESEDRFDHKNGYSEDANKEVSADLIVKLAKETADLVRNVPGLMEWECQSNFIGTMASKGGVVAADLATLLFWLQFLIRKKLGQEKLDVEETLWCEEQRIDLLILRSMEKTKAAVQDYIKAQEDCHSGDGVGDKAGEDTEKEVTADLIVKLSKDTADLVRDVPDLREMERQINMIGTMASEGGDVAELAPLLFCHQFVIRKHLGQEKLDEEETNWCEEPMMERLILRSTEKSKAAVHDYIKGNTKKTEEGRGDADKGNAEIEDGEGRDDA